MKPKKDFGPHPNAKNSPIEPKKAQNDAKKQKLKNSENKKSYKIKVINQYEYYPKILGPLPNSNNNLVGPKRLKMTL